MDIIWIQVLEHSVQSDKGTLFSESMFGPKEVCRALFSERQGDLLLRRHVRSLHEIRALFSERQNVKLKCL